MANDKLATINKIIDDAEDLRARALLEALLDPNTRPPTKKDILIELLDSIGVLSMGDAKQVVNEAHKVFFDRSTPKAVMVKISAALKKFRNKKDNKGKKSYEETIKDKNVIEVEVPDFL